MPFTFDPSTGLPTKKKTAATPGGYSFNPDNPGPQLSGQDLDPAVAGRINSGYTGNSPAGSITMAGNTPNYQELIANDPVFKQLQADLQAQGYGDLASRNAALNRLFVGYGSVPDLNAAGQQLGINDLGQAIDPTTAQLAGENQYSTTARLTQAHTDAIRQIQRGLAARGALQSGELGYQLGKENTAYGGAQNDSTQALLDAISQLQGGYTAAERQRQAALNAGLGDATNRQIGLNPATGSQTATYDPATGKYKGSNGELYNPDGTPYVPQDSLSGSSSGGVTSDVGAQEYAARQAAQQAQGYHTAGF